jgi:DnaJ-class molecular chaperone
MTQTTCPSCNGSGLVTKEEHGQAYTDTCRRCAGTGLIPATHDCKTQPENR